MKALNMIVAIIAIIALVGDIAFMVVALGTAGEVIDGIKAELSNVPELAGASNTFILAVNLAWIWTILVLITCVFAIKYSLLDSRKKK